MPLDAKEIQHRIDHGYLNVPPRDFIQIVPSTFKGMKKNAMFIDARFGEWEGKPHHVIRDGSRHPERVTLNYRLKAIAEIKKKLPPNTTIVEDSYVAMNKPATFVDSLYGEWSVIASHVIHKGGRHPKIAINNRKLDPLEVLHRIQNGYKDIKPRPYVSFNLSDYKSNTNKITFTDSEYGTWECSPAEVMNGQEHPERGSTRWTPRKIDKAIQKDRPFISIKADTYTNAGTPCTFVDSEYGEWQAQPIFVMGTGGRPGNNHPERFRKNRQTPASEINRRIREGYKGIPPRDYFYLVEDSYDGIMNPADFIDSEHGPFRSIPNNVVDKGGEHPKRTFIHMDLTLEDIKSKLPDNIQIVETTFIKLYEKATFIDSDQGEWSAKPYDVVINGTRHPKIQYLERIVPHEEIQRRITKGWNDSPPRDYLTLVPETYKQTNKKATFIDRDYGPFNTVVQNVTQGSNHPARAFLHTDLEIYAEALLEVPRFNTRLDNDTRIRPDFKLSETVYVEVDGLYWHSELEQPDSEHHQKRRHEFEKRGFRVLQFRSDEVYHWGEVVKSMSRAAINEFDIVIDAADTEIRSVVYDDAKIFFEANHLKRCLESYNAIGLFYNGVLVSCLAYTLNKDNDLYVELHCDVINTRVVGSFRKLLDSVGDKPLEVTRKLDLRYEVFVEEDMAGFKFVEEYVQWDWTDGTCTHDASFTVSAEAKENKVYKIWDAGQAVYVRSP